MQQNDIQMNDTTQINSISLQEIFDVQNKYSILRIGSVNTLEIMLLLDQICKYLQFCSIPLPETVYN